VNELITNAIQHSRPVRQGGGLHIILKDHADNFSISVFDPGDGPTAAAEAPGSLGKRHSGLGTRIVETLARQIDATIAKDLLANGYKVTITVPHRSAVSKLG